MREPTVKAPPLPDKGYPLDRFYEQKLNPPQTDVKPPACSEIDTDHAVSLRQLPARTWNGGLRGHFLPHRRGGNQGQSVCRDGDPGAAGALFAPQKGGNQGQSVCRNGDPGAAGALFAPQKGGNQGQSVCRNGDPGAAGALFAPQKGGQSGPKCVQERGSWSRGGTFCPTEGGAIRAKVCAGTDTMSVAATWRFWNGCGLVQKTIISLHHAPALREPDWRRPTTFLFEESPNHTNYISMIVHVNSCSTQAL